MWDGTYLRDANDMEDDLEGKVGEIYRVAGVRREYIQFKQRQVALFDLIH